MSKFSWVFALIFVIGSQWALADVVHKAKDGFELKIATSVPATPEQAYKKFVDIGSWWSAEHTWWGKAENLSLEPKAGGCFCEIEGDKSVLHMTVAFVAPNREVRMLGGLGPLQQMGLNGVLTFKFIPVSDNETRVVQIYRVSGYDPNGLEALAPIVDQVQTLQMNRFRDQFAAQF